MLNEEQIKRIHNATLEVLEHTGVRITHSRAREILAGAGARSDGDIVRLPAYMVQDALQKACTRVVLGKRNAELGVVLEGTRSWFGPTLDCIDYLAPGTNERRRYRLEDCRTAAKVLDALPNYYWGMVFGLADDVPAGLADRLVLKEALTHCEKPMVFCCKDNQSLNDIYEMAVLLAGGEKAFLESPPIIMLADPISPLFYPGEVVEKMIFCAEKGIPQICYGAPQAGSTAPASFAGAVLQGSAESLAGLVITQNVCRGAPFVYGALATVMDMRTTIFSYGAPEMSLMGAALAQMAQFYDLPVFGTAGCSDAKFPDPQAAAEATFSCLSSALCGANLVHDCGLLDHGSLVSPENMVLVNELLHMVDRLTGGIQVDDETLAVDLIDWVGPCGHYLEADHTYRHFRNVWYSNLFDRNVYDVWLEQGARRFEEQLREQTLKLMDYQPTELPAEVIQELDRMAKHWS